MTPAEYHNTLWRISSTEAVLNRRNFITLGLPPPNAVAFQEYGEKATNGLGEEVRRGFAQIQLAWENMTPRQAATLRAEIEAGVTAGYLWLTVDRASGHAPGPDWVDIKGKPYLPDWATVAKTYSQVYDQLALRLLAVEVINAPALPNYVYPDQLPVGKIIVATDATGTLNPGGSSGSFVTIAPVTVLGDIEVSFVGYTYAGLDESPPTYTALVTAGAETLTPAGDALSYWRAARTIRVWDSTNDGTRFDVPLTPIGAIDVTQTSTITFDPDADPSLHVVIGPVTISADVQITFYYFDLMGVSIGIESANFTAGATTIIPPEHTVGFWESVGKINLFDATNAGSYFDFIFPQPA